MLMRWRVTIFPKTKAEQYKKKNKKKNDENKKEKFLISVAAVRSLCCASWE